MSRYVPLDIDYKTLNRIDTALNYILWASTILSLGVLILEITKVFPLNNEFLQQTLNSIICTLAVIYFIGEVILNLLFQFSEIKRRKDFIDNSLGTTLSVENSTGYFNNQNTSVGILKMGKNCFESSLFSKTISGKMVVPMVFKALMVIIIFLVLALFTNNKTLTTVLQLTLPLSVIQQCIKLYYFSHRVNRVFEEFQYIFSNARVEERENLIISNVMNYESTLAWGSILLDDGLFKKLNPTLSQDWENIKIRYSL